MTSNSVLKSWYKEARDKTKEKMNVSNPMEIPMISKIVINIGLKESAAGSKAVQNIMNLVGMISGQKPVKALAKKSIAGFKIREGMPIGVFVTLRGVKMLSFLSKLINLALPRVRDFQGVPGKLDGNGNYNLGLKDISVFPEAETTTTGEVTSGLNITIVTTADRDELAKALIQELGMPFQRKNKN